MLHLESKGLAFTPSSVATWFCDLSQVLDPFGSLFLEYNINGWHWLVSQPPADLTFREQLDVGGLYRHSHPRGIKWPESKSEAWVSVSLQRPLWPFPRHFWQRIGSPEHGWANSWRVQEDFHSTAGPRDKQPGSLHQKTMTQLRQANYILYCCPLTHTPKCGPRSFQPPLCRTSMGNGDRGRDNF